MFGRIILGADADEIGDGRSFRSSTRDGNFVNVEILAVFLDVMPEEDVSGRVPEEDVRGRPP